MRPRTIALGVLLWLAGSSGAATAAIVKNLSTGIVNSTGLKIGNNVADADYVIATGGTGGRFGTVPVARQSPLSGGWLADAASSASRWIVINSGQGSESMSVETGSFLFQTTVDLTGYNPATAFLDALRYTADNKLTALRINGTTVFSQGSDPAEEFGSFIALPTTLGQGLFVSGVNTITFEVLNTPPPPHLSTTPVGLRLEGAVSATVPEPTACVALAMPVAMCVLARRRTQDGRRSHA